MDPTLVLVAGAALATASVGTLAGFGGAILLVPVLTLLGLPPGEAIPIGLLTVAGGSISAAAGQIDRGYVNHRLGVTVEAATSAGAILGALVATSLSPALLRLAIASTAFLAACASAVPPRSRPAESAGLPTVTPGEWPASLAGAYEDEGTLVEYAPSRPAGGAVALLFVGVIAGASGTSGGFLKTPALNRIMRVPVKVATATTTFTVSLTAAAALAVLLPRGALDLHQGAAAVFGALLGGRFGQSLHHRVPGRVVPSVVAIALLSIAVVLVITA